MSWLDRGKPRTQFDRFKTYEHERVQQRLNSVLPAVMSKVEQALAVDTTRVIVYKRARFGLPCSCNKSENFDQDLDAGHENNLKDKGKPVTFKTTNNGGMFGGARSSITLDDMDDDSTNVMDHADILSGTEDEEYTLTPDAGGNINCGICYRQQVQPGYSATGFSYVVCTHHHVKDMTGFTLDQSTAPSSFRAVRKGADNFVEFSALIPKYFKTARYSVRNNEHVMEAWPRPKVVIDGKEHDLTLSALDNVRGREVRIRVWGQEQFTHLVMIFDQGLPPINGNISEEASVLSYEEELTVGSLTIVLPARVGQLEPGDILSIPFKNYILKIIDAPKKRTAKNEQWEWVCICRALQRKEYQFGIDKGYDVR